MGIKTELARCTVCGDPIPKIKDLSGWITVCTKTSCWISRWEKIERDAYRENMNQMLTVPELLPGKVKAGDMMKLQARGQL